MTSAGLDLKNPGGKETVVVAGAALGLGLIYFAFSKKTGTPPPSQVPASGHGLGAAPANQSFLPGGASATGNAFTDTLFTTPATPSPGTFTPPGPGPTSPTPTRVSIPVLHVPQGAQSVLGSGPVSGGAPSGGSITSLTGANPVQWAASVLQAAGFPKTAANLQSLVAWALNEGGGGANNPLNTTQGALGATNFNSVGVKNFPSVSTGVQATAQTIHNGNYPNIVADLQSGKGIGANAAADLSKWSGGGYSSLAGNWASAGGIIARIQAAALKMRPVASVKPATAAQVRSHFPTVYPRHGYIGPSIGRLVLSFQAAWRKAFPPPHPSHRVTPRRGPGHPVTR